ncbi:hypothetical protein CANTEDRAFT_97923 [Yamadazyma tenuis ATCC 10573]|uniref:L-lactate dehydrogenase (cytochrome) n=1 Tax=Candida tenuis (strain ATCC 10573 / BCRC 21748 / CBS 615 / JCM 9827 / NBRC 10315 / NRRL Y-1498 / VKM Y-70) TaxID=590646 RepID=G3B401_CANTC|nr:uncharacterized protein CANTEDRAFT_97923 [Yamadazyma tenuis ATCC 10573]EGV63902.1 hypothetical protein CANTEDRAFT_97923 [Yamadazyma tenuis ATCC 10573]
MYRRLVTNSVKEYGFGLKRCDKKINAEDVAKHDNLDNGVWVVINGKVYDLTTFINMHPGGTSIILKYAGKDASFLFNKVHARGTIESILPEECYLGELDGELEEFDDPMIREEKRSQEMRAKRPPLMSILNLTEFEYVAQKILPIHAWAYYSGGSDDEVTLRENNSAYGRYYFKPKVLVDVDDVDISTEMLDTKTSAPFYCSAAASAKLGHPDGELSIARGLYKENIIQMISSASSYPMDEIVEETPGPKWFQLYVKPDREESLETIRECEELGVKAIFVTVDTPLFGRREKDLRFKIADTEDIEAVDLNLKDSDDFILSYDKIRLKWSDIETFKKNSSIPIVVKGIQRVEDVLLAIENKADAVVLSNHGGRQLDFARPPIDVLAELMPILRERNLDDKIEVFIDGGVRRGSDVLKALCLGAKGVGLGRSFLYANSSYGENGVIKACKLLKDEISRDMKLLGVTKVSELTPDLIHTYPAVFTSHNNIVYEPLYLPQFKE